MAIVKQLTDAMLLDLPDLPDGWACAPLSTLVDERGISYGIVQPGSEDQEGVPIVRVNNLKEHRIITDDAMRVSRDIEAKYKRTRLRGGEVLLSLVGSLGEIAVVPSELAGWNVARAIGVIPVLSDVGAEWVAICLRSVTVQHYISTWATTTVQATLNLRDVANLPIPMPPKHEREAIANILGTLDDKIELNRKMNQTLEAMARAIFKSWFVDFDPVRAKAESRDSGLPPNLAALFPHSFEDSELGGIPKGWKATTLEDVIAIHDSKRIPLSNRERAERYGHYPYYGAASVMDYVDDYLFDGIYVLIGEDGSVVNEDDTPVIQYVWGKFWVNNHAHVLTGKNSIAVEHLLLYLKQINIRSFVTGAVQPKLNQSNLCRVPFILPPGTVCGAFSRMIDPLFARIRANIEESRTLATLRDALLPKLLSGEIRVV